MCGFVGFFSTTGKPFCDDAAAALARACAAIAHRGPDDEQAWLADDGMVGLGFRRLAIIDLSIEGRQPMRSRDGRYVAVFNGEIYNFRQLRATLDDEALTDWRGHSDTEVLLELIARKGVEAALADVDGMFALALWDTRDATLTLARDRFGEKPLYYGWSEGGLVFGSELKALRALPGFDATLNEQSIARYLRLSYIPASESVYRSYRKVPPATLVRFERGAPGHWPEPAPYWSATDAMRTAHGHPLEGDYEEILSAVDDVFTASVTNRLVSDVPVGAFLSGGIDSSLTVASAMQTLDRPLQTFSVGFDEERFNEAPYAARIAAHLGTDHTEIIVRENDVLSFIDQLPDIYDEPFADASQLPTTLLCRRVREHVTVAVSGDGGDELFCGYDRYLDRPAAWASLSGRAGARTWAGSLANALPVGPLDAVHGLRGKPGRLGKKWFAALNAMTARTPETYFLTKSSFWRDGVPVNGVERSADLLSFVTDPEIADASPLARFMLMDAGLYLPDDLMVKVDRAAMSTSLEVRTPFLNAELATLAWSIPQEHYEPACYGLKRVLKDVLARKLPRELFERPKMGFEVPLRYWLRNDLRSWGDDLVADPSPYATDILDIGRIAARWRDHQRGANMEGDLWPALVLLQWMRANAA